MLQNHATLQEIRNYLLEECRKTYPPGEASSVSSLVLEHVGIQNLRAISEPDFRPGQEITAQIKEIVAEIHSLRPIQYILGESLFYGLRLKLDERVLIPRPETEELIHRIVEDNREPGNILDLGCGSGCIALALKKAFPGSRVRGLDLALEALQLAGKNSILNHLEVEWLEGDILEGAFPEADGGYGLIVSNPPYVRESEKAFMERNVLDFEPAEALFVSDEDPLLFYRAIAANAQKVLTRGGVLWLEINEAFGNEVKALLRKTHFGEVHIIRDIHGKERFAKAIR